MKNPRSRKKREMKNQLMLCFSTMKRWKMRGQPSTDRLSRPFMSTVAKSSVTVDYFPFASEPEVLMNSEPDLASALASRRLFFGNPGRSNSIVESSRSGMSSSRVVTRRQDSVAVRRCSQDPYADFRRSMEEMVEARGLRDVRRKWECLQELLGCYLALNSKSTHKVIFGAFSDVLSTLVASSMATNEINNS